MCEVPDFSSRDELLSWLVSRAVEEQFVVVIYSWYQANVLHEPVGARPRHQAVTTHAMNGSRMDLEGLGTVQLDTFIVESNSGKPANGHWDRHDLTYDEGDWEKILGGACVLHIRARRKTNAETNREVENLMKLLD